MNVSMQENVVTRHIMEENPSAESPWQRGTFSEKQYFYPDKRHLQTSGLLPPPISRPKQHHQGVRLHPVGTSSSPEITCMGVCPHSKALQGGIQSQFLTAFYRVIMCLRIRYNRHYRIMKGARNEVKRQRLESSWSESH